MLPVASGYDDGEELRSDVLRQSAESAFAHQENTVAKAEDTVSDAVKPEAKKARPNCTRCQGSSYSYENHAIAGVDGLLVFCSQCGGIFSWSPRVPKYPPRE